MLLARRMQARRAFNVRVRSRWSAACHGRLLLSSTQVLLQDHRREVLRCEGDAGLKAGAVGGLWCNGTCGDCRGCGTTIDLCGEHGGFFSLGFGYYLFDVLVTALGRFPVAVAEWLGLGSEVQLIKKLLMGVIAGCSCRCWHVVSSRLLSTQNPHRDIMWFKNITSATRRARPTSLPHNAICYHQLIHFDQGS